MARCFKRSIWTVVAATLTQFVWAGSIIYLHKTHDPLPVRVAVGLLPLLPALWTMSLGYKAFKRRDELARLIWFEGCTYALFGTLALLFCYQVATTTGLTTADVPWEDAWVVLAVILGVGITIAERRYRVA